MTLHAKHGAKGGRSRSKAKGRAARRNGRLGGRPRNEYVAALMVEYGRSRAWVYKMLRDRLEAIVHSN